MSSISVIVPVYNGARFIVDALGSICSQSYSPLEIIVADDKSTDDTCKVVHEYARAASIPIRLVSMERNTGGPYAPASVAFGHTSGEFVCILDADDMFAPDAFETYMRMFAAGGKDVGLATSDFIVFEDGTKRELISSTFAQHADVLRGVISGNREFGVTLDSYEAMNIFARAFIIPFKGMLRRDAWIDLGGPNLNYRVICDVDFIWRLLKEGRFKVQMINRPLMLVRSWSGSMSKQNLSMSEELVDIYEVMLSEVKDKSLKPVLRNRLNAELYDLAYTAFKEHRFVALIKAATKLYASKAVAAISPAASDSKGML